MRSIGAFLTVAILTNASALGADATTDIQKLAGQWRVAHRAYGASRKATEIGKILSELGNIVKIEDDKLSPAESEKKSDGLDIQFDPTAKPKSVDLTLSDKKPTLYGVYSLEGSILALNFGVDGTRPKSSVRTGDEVLLILKRIPAKQTGKNEKSEK
jgi:uncharacterized protein (TIGR03067 family)